MSIGEKGVEEDFSSETCDDSFLSATDGDADQDDDSCLEDVS